MSRWSALLGEPGPAVESGTRILPGPPAADGGSGVGAVAGSERIQRRETVRLQREPAPGRAVVPLGAAQSVEGAENDQNPESLARKAEAKAWLEEQIAAGVDSPEQFASLMGQVSTRFGLSDLMVDMRSSTEIRIGFASSPWLWASYLPNKPIGNRLSDWLLWGYYGTGSTMSDVGRWWRSDLRKKTDQTNITWGPLTGRGFGSYMLADPLTTFGPPGSSPSVTNDTNNILLKRRQKKKKGSASYYVLGHLLNDNVHGPGDDMKNLTPLSQRTNNHSPVGHLKAVEKTVKAEVKKAPLAYQVIPEYGRSPLAWPRYFSNAFNFASSIGDVLAAEDHVPVGLRCKVWRYDPDGARTLIVDEFVPQMQVGKVADFDHYYIKTPAGQVVDITENAGVWKAAEVAFMTALGAALAYTQIEAAELLAEYGASVGQSVADVVAANSYATVAVAALLATYLATRETGATNVVLMAGLAGALALSQLEVASVLADYTASIGVTTVEFLAEHQGKVSVVAGLLSGYMSSGKNQFAKDPSLGL